MGEISTPAALSMLRLPQAELLLPGDIPAGTSYLCSPISSLLAVLACQKTSTEESGDHGNEIQALTT